MACKVAVLDKERSLRRLISLIIRQKGHKALTFKEPVYCPVYTGQERCCPREEPCVDLMIMDSRLSRMHALNLIRIQNEGACKILTHNKLVLSTNMSRTELRLAEELGCRISRKPFHIEDILLWLDECGVKEGDGETQAVDDECLRAAVTQ